MFRNILLFVAFTCISVSTSAQLSGSYTIPSTQFPTLKSIIDSLNIQGISASVTVNFTPATGETAPVGGYRLGSATLNANLSASKTLTINGNGNNITAYVGTSTSSDGIFWIAGADYVTINNLNLLESSANTTSTTMMEFGYALVKQSPIAPYDGCQYDVINGCIITLNYLNAASYGVILAHYQPGSNIPLNTAGITNVSLNSYNRISGCTISNVNYGIRSIGVNSGALTYDKGNIYGGSTTAQGNNITVGGGTSVAFGIYPSYDSVIAISNNNFHIASGQNAITYEVYMGTGFGDLTVTKNNFDLNCSLATYNAFAYYNYGTSSGHGDIGQGLAAQSTHTISNNTFSGNNLTATTSSVYNIYEYYANCRTLNIQNNSITNENWGLSTGNIYGIYLYFNYAISNNVTNNYIYKLSKLGQSGFIYLAYCYLTASPTGVFNYLNNTYRNITSNFYIYHYIYGSNTSPPTGYPGCKLIDKYNSIDSVDMSGATSTNYFYNYFGYYGADSSEIAYNTFSNIKMSNTVQGYIYNYSYGYYGPNQYIVRGNTFKNYSGYLFGTYNYLGYYSTICDSNTVSNISSISTGNSFVYNNLANYLSGTCSNNRINNINLAGGYVYNYLGYYGSNPSIHHNAITNINIAGPSGYIYNYMGYYCSGATINNNRIDSMTTGSTTNYPWYTFAQIGDFNIYNNIVSNISTTNTSISLFPYFLTGTGVTVNFYNNILSKVNFPANYAGTGSAGVNLDGPINYKVYNNTIYLKPGITGATGYGLTGILYSAAGTLDLRNNIINVDATPNGAYVSALRRSSGSTGTSPSNFLGTSNGNIFYAPNVTNSYLYSEGTSFLLNTYNLTNDVNFNTPCGLFKAFVGHDYASFTENNLITASLPATYVPGGSSYAEKGAVPTSSPAVTSDYAGTSRGPIADMGALEFNGTNIDHAPPVISYTPVPVSNYCTNAPTILATITDNSGVAAGPSIAPRLYFKKSTENNAFGGTNTSSFNGWKFVNASAISGTLYTFNFNFALLTSSVAPGDSITYFIIAQDSAATPNTGASIGSFSVCPSNVVLTNTNGDSLNYTPAPNGFRILYAPNYTVTAYPPSVCLSGSSTLNLYPVSAGVSVQWQSATLTGAFTNISGANAFSLSTGTRTLTTRYRAQIYCGSTVLTTSTIDTFQVANPAILTTTGYSHCGYGTGPLSVTSSPGSSANWYTSATGGTSIFSGNTYLPPPSAATKTYYVTATTPNGSSEIVTKSPPFSYNNTTSVYGIEMVFDNNSTNLYSSTVYPNGSGTISVDLFDSSGLYATAGPFTVSGTGITSPNVLNYGSSFMNLHKGHWLLQVNPTYTGTPYMNYETGLTFPFNSPSGKAHIVGGCYNGSPNGYAAYYFFFYNNVISSDCEAVTRTPVTITSTPATPLSIAASKLPGICLGATDTLTVSSSNPYYLINWYYTLGGVSPFSTNTIVVAPSTTNTYYVLGTDPYTGCIGIDSITIYVNSQPSPPTISPSPTSICSGASANLQVTPPIALPAVATVGSGTASNTSTSFPTPYGAFYTSNHVQYMFTVAELNAAGITPGNITSLAFNQSAGYTGNAMGNFQIMIAALPASTTSLTGFVNPGGWATVYNNASYLPPTAAGWVSYPLSTSFYWNGTSPIIIDVQHMNCTTCPTTACTSYTFNGTVYYSPTSYNSVVYDYADGDCSVTTFTPATYYLSGNRANILFNVLRPSSINWLNVGNMFKNPALTNAVSLTDTTTSVYVSPANTTIYRAVANLQGCLSTPVSDTVNVIPAPVVTISPSGPDTICNGNSVSLCIPTGGNQSYQWYKTSVASGNAIAGATANCYSANAAGTYYCVATNILTGCTATSAGTVVVVNPAPTVTMGGKNSTTFCNGGSDTLIAGSATGVSYQWQLNGVNIAGATGTQYVATASGVYTVTVKNALGCSVVSSAITITNNAIPVGITPLGSLTFCTGSSVVLSSGPLVSGISYQWYNGSTAITGATSNTYTATTSGNYYVKVSNAATGCSDSSNHLNVVSGSAPSAAITPSPTASFCAGGGVLLKTNSSLGITRNWYLNGSVLAGANDSLYYATAAGSYTVNVAITGTPTCSSTTTIPTVVSVNPLPTATVTAAGSTTFCQGGSVTLNANTGTGLGYQWNLNGVSLASGGTSSSYTATSSGNYTVTVTNLSTGCSNTSAAIAVTVNPAPPVTVTASGPITFCKGGSVVLTSSATTASYGLTWKNNGSAIPGQTATTLTVTSTGLYTVTAVNATTGCVATSAVTSVQVNALPSDSTTPNGSVNLCQYSTLNLSAVPVDTTMNYQWKLNGSAISSATTGTYGATAAGTYNLVITNKITGCQIVSPNIVVSVIAAPTAVATAIGNTTICQGDSTKLIATVGTGLSYQWKLNGGSIVGATDTVYYASLPGNYSVAVTNTSLCTASSTPVVITVYPRPAAYITYNSSLNFCAGDSIILLANVGTGLTYQWLMNGTPLPNYGISYVADSTGSYSVQVANTYNCISTSASVNVLVYPTPVPFITNTGTNLQTAMTYMGYQWFFNTNPISGANSNSYTYSANGTYQVYVVDSNGCVGYSNQITLTNVGVSNPILGNSIKVYPNPTTGVLNIDSRIVVKLTVQDVTGKTIIEASNVKSIDLGDIANGTYLLYITDMEGHLLRTEKVTKSNK